MIIVLDGPAGSGKSSTARAVADRLQIEYLDSGALYRTAALIYIEANRDTEKFFRLLDQKEISFRYKNKRFYVAVDGNSVTDEIRSPEVAGCVSDIAAMPRVRVYVNNLMRKVVLNGVYIAEGRDLGTAVFPDADLKFYMSADLEERARRRFKERKMNNPALTFIEVKQNIAERDRKDSRRQTDPLKKAEDAIEIDTTNLTFEQQVNQICSEVKQQMKD